MQTMIAWIVTFLVSVAPPVSRCYGEAEDQYEARLHSIVQSAASVAFDLTEERLESGEWGYEMSLMRMLAVASHESMGFNERVDNGQLRGDKGASGCLMGLMVDKRGKAEHWTLKELTEDRHLCFLVGYHRMKLSQRVCGKGQNSLAVYASGKCHVGRAVSKEMWTQGRDWGWRLVAANERGEWGPRVFGPEENN